MTPEGKIKVKFSKGLKELQERYGKLMIRMPVSRGMGKPMLDYVLCVNGKFVMVEAKRDAEHEMTTQQLRTKDECIAAGGMFFLIYDAITISMALSAIACLIHK